MRYFWCVMVVVTLLLLGVGCGVDKEADQAPEPTASPEPADGPRLGDTQVRSADGMVMVYVPAGAFQMGSDDDAVDQAMQACSQFQDGCKREWFEGELPAHTVTLDRFWLDQTEVTNAQYRKCVEAGACKASTRCDWGEPTYENPAKADHPVACLGWGEAKAYCEWAGGRLPTEAEWEYAARGEAGNRYPWGDTFDGSRLNFCDVNCAEEWKDVNYDDGYAVAAPVGSFPDGASWCGGLDMAGNVWEWVSDWYQAYPSERQVNPAGPDSGQYKVLRGGAWLNGSSDVRGANRGQEGPSLRYADVGFRCAQDP